LPWFSRLRQFVLREPAKMGHEIGDLPSQLKPAKAFPGAVREKPASKLRRPEGRTCFRVQAFTRSVRMLWTIFVILLILWLLGFSFHIAGGLIHLLLVIAVVVLLIQLITGRRVV
jgi:hypothetical protein